MTQPLFSGYISVEEVDKRVQKLKQRVDGLCGRLVGDPDWDGLDGSTTGSTTNNTNNSTPSGTTTNNGTNNTNTNNGTTNTNTNTNNSTPSGTTNTDTGNGTTNPNNTNNGNPSGTTNNGGTSNNGGTNNGYTSGDSGTGYTDGNTYGGTNNGYTSGGYTNANTSNGVIDRTLTCTRSLMFVDVPRAKSTLQVYGYVRLEQGIIVEAKIMFQGDFYPNGRAEQAMVTRRAWVSNNSWVGIQALIRNNGTFKAGDFGTQAYSTLAIIPNDVPGAHKIEITLPNPNLWCDNADLVRTLACIEF